MGGADKFFIQVKKSIFRRDHHKPYSPITHTFEHVTDNNFGITPLLTLFLP